MTYIPTLEDFGDYNFLVIEDRPECPRIGDEAAFNWERHETLESVEAFIKSETSYNQQNGYENNTFTVYEKVTEVKERPYTMGGIIWHL